MTTTFTKKIQRVGVAGVTLAAFATAGCSDLPGNEEQQGAVIGGAGGAAAGAALYKDNRALGALVGGLLGAGGGYLVGTQIDKDEGEARDAARDARENPATVDEVDDSDSADLDGNGFVTMDELLAMEEANLSSNEIIDRAEATDQVFDFNDQQERELLDAGYDRETLSRLRNVNRDVIERYERENDDTSDRISQPRDS